MLRVMAKLFKILLMEWVNPNLINSIKKVPAAAPKLFIFLLLFLSAYSKVQVFNQIVYIFYTHT